MTAVFDGHNDALGKLEQHQDAPEGFLTGLPDRQVDLPRARAGGLAAGMFAINAPSPEGRPAVADDGSWAEAPADALDPAGAAAFTLGAVGRAHALVAASEGAVVLARTAADLDDARARGALAMVLHLEGAEAIDPGLFALDVLEAAGVRSIGLVWSRPSVFGHGVPFRYPSSPDTGPGLTDAGLALVRRCAERRIAVDVSHLNAAGFADVARLAAAPIIASHCACHALCPTSRNLTDDQLRELAASEGIVGIVYAVPFIRPDGHDDPDTPLAVLVAHVRHAVAVAGIDHVGLGSDFDGAPMPLELADVAAVPALLAAMRDDGFSAAEVEQIAWGNWRRVLERAWGA